MLYFLSVQPSATPVAAPVVGGGDAAAQWIAQAKAENDDDTVNAVQNAAVSLHNHLTCLVYSSLEPEKQNTQIQMYIISDGDSLRG